MIRYSMFLIATAGFFAGLISSTMPERAAATTPPGHNETVIVKNQAFPVFGPIEVEDCATDDCSEPEAPGVEV